MAGSVNKVILIGNVGKDPEVRNTQAGAKIVNLSLATSESWTDRASGERKERTEWHRVVIFNERVAEAVEKYVHRGSKIYVEGALQTRKWTDQSGAERYSTEVVVSAYKGEVTFLGDGAGGNRGADSQQGGASDGGYGKARAASARQPTHAPAASGPKWGTDSDLDDEIPF